MNLQHLHNGQFVNPKHQLAKKMELNKLQPHTDVKVDIFDLSNEEDLEKYRHIFQRAGLHQIKIFEEQKQFIDETKNWKVFIKWGTIFLDDSYQKTKSVIVNKNGTVNYRELK